MSVEHEYRDAADECGQRHAKKQAVVTHDGISQPRHVAENCRQHGTCGQNPTRPAQMRNQQTNGGEQFPNPLTPSPPGFRPHFLKYINRLGGRREFEEERLEHDAGSN